MFLSTVNTFSNPLLCTYLVRVEIWTILEIIEHTGEREAEHAHRGKKRKKRKKTLGTHEGVEKALVGVSREEWNERVHVRGRKVRLPIVIG